MHLSPHSLRQLDHAYLDSLGEVEVRALSGKLLDDLKEAWDRLNQGPENSSRPPSSRAVWERSGGGQESAEAPAAAHSSRSRRNCGRRRSHGRADLQHAGRQQRGAKIGGIGRRGVLLAKIGDFSSIPWAGSSPAFFIGIGGRMKSASAGLVHRPANRLDNLPQQRSADIRPAKRLG